MEPIFKFSNTEPIPTPSTLQEFQQKLQEKESFIKILEQKYSKLLEDFSYNVSLIYERDKEIDNLNRKIDELLRVNREKDIQLVSLQSLYTRIKQLESDKVILTGRVEALLSSNKVPRPSRKSSTPVPEDSPSLIKQEHKRCSSVDRKTNFSTPLSKINSDLEKRIHALEEETQVKAEIVVTKECVSNKEKEISELIKSLSPYKREGRKLAGSLDRGMEGFLKDVKRIKDNISSTGLRGSVCEEDVKHMPVIRSIFSVERPR